MHTCDKKECCCSRSRVRRHRKIACIIFQCFLQLVCLEILLISQIYSGVRVEWDEEQLQNAVIPFNRTLLSVQLHVVDDYAHFWWGSCIVVLKTNSLECTSNSRRQDIIARNSKIHIDRQLHNWAGNWQLLKSSPPITWRVGQTVKCAVHSAGYQTSIRMSERNKFVTTSVLLAGGRSSRQSNRWDKRAAGKRRWRASAWAGDKGNFERSEDSRVRRFHRSARRASGCQLVLGQ